MATKRKSPEPKLREFCFTGTVELHGVTFFVTAIDKEEAREKAKAGEYVDYESNSTETVNWSIDPDSIEPNE